jgi:hypothetical protein
MGGTIPTTLFGCDLALLGSFGKLAAPRLASASETSRETLAPMMDMVPTRGDWHEPHLLSILLPYLLSRVCNCAQFHPGFGDKLSRFLN